MQNTRLKLMSEQMSLLVEAKVLIEQVEMSYGFPRLKGWLERYDSLFRSSRLSPCEGATHSPTINQQSEVQDV